MARQYDIDARTVIRGSGPPLLLAHGIGGPAMLVPLAEHLEPHFTLVIPTWPGYLPADGRVRYDDVAYADFVRQVRDHFAARDERFTGGWSAAGFSTGGRAILNHLIESERAFDRVVLIDTMGMNTFSFLFVLPFRLFARAAVRTVFTTPRRLERLVREEFRDANGPSADRAVATMNELVANPVVRENIVDAYARVGRRSFQWKTDLRGIRTPTLILWGANDVTCPAYFAVELNKHLRNSRLEVLPELRHHSVMEAPERFAERMIPFLSGVESYSPL